MENNRHAEREPQKQSDPSDQSRFRTLRQTVGYAIDAEQRFESSPNIRIRRLRIEQEHYTIRKGDVSDFDTSPFCYIDSKP